THRCTRGQGLPFMRQHRIIATIVVLVAIPWVVSACGGGGDSSSATKTTASTTQKIGQGEGQLNVIAWEGYTQPEWVKPFEKQTGCQVHAKYGGSAHDV